MTVKFTTQDIIDMGATLYDNRAFTREQIRVWLTALVASGCSEFDIDRMFDLIVG